MAGAVEQQLRQPPPPPPPPPQQQQLQQLLPDVERVLRQVQQAAAPAAQQQWQQPVAPAPAAQPRAQQQRRSTPREPASPREAASADEPRPEPLPQHQQGKGFWGLNKKWKQAKRRLRDAGLDEEHLQALAQAASLAAAALPEERRQEVRLNPQHSLDFKTALGHIMGIQDETYLKNHYWLAWAHELRCDPAAAGGTG